MRHTITQEIFVDISGIEFFIQIRQKSTKCGQTFIYAPQQSMALPAPILTAVTQPDGIRCKSCIHFSHLGQQTWKP